MCPSAGWQQALPSELAQQMVSDDWGVEAAKALPGPSWALVGTSQARAHVQRVLGCNGASAPAAVCIESAPGVMRALFWRGVA